MIVNRSTSCPYCGDSLYIIPNFTDYLLCKNAHLYSNKYGKLKKRKIHLGKRGYLAATLRANCSTYVRTIHRLLCSVFKIDYTDDLVVNHIDGNKLNNDLNNLEMCTTYENNRHARELGFAYWARGEQVGSSKLTAALAMQIKDLALNGYYTQKDIGFMYGIDNSAVCRIKNGKQWGWV